MTLVFLSLEFILDLSKCKDKGIYKIRHIKFIILLEMILRKKAQMGGIKKDIIFGNIQRKESLSNDKHDNYFLKHQTLVGTIYVKLC